MSRTLTDMSADMRAEDSEIRSEYSAAQIVSDVSVRMPYLYIKTLRGEEVRVGNVSELINQDARDFIKKNIDDKYHISQEIISDVCQLQSSLIYCWDKDAEKYRVEVRVDGKGNISELYVPTDSKISEDIIISRMNNGDEVFESIKRSLKDRIYKLETMELFVNSNVLRKSNDYVVEEEIPIYQKKSKSFRESYIESSDDGRKFDQDLKSLGFFSAIMISTSLFWYITVSYSSSESIILLGATIMILSTIFWMIGSILSIEIAGNSIEAKFFKSDFTYEEVTSSKR